MQLISWVTGFVTILNNYIFGKKLKNFIKFYKNLPQKLPQKLLQNLPLNLPPPKTMYKYLLCKDLLQDL